MIIMAPLSVLLSLAVTGILIIEFFLLVRLVRLCRQVKWLSSFDHAGQRLVADAMSLVQRIWNQIATAPLSQKGKVIIGLAVLEILRITICAITG